MDEIKEIETLSFFSYRVINDNFETGYNNFKNCILSLFPNLKYSPEEIEAMKQSDQPSKEINNDKSNEFQNPISEKNENEKKIQNENENSNANFDVKINDNINTNVDAKDNDNVNANVNDNINTKIIAKLNDKANANVDANVNPDANVNTNSSS